jgi:hypothetical protein
LLVLLETNLLMEKRFSWVLGLKGFCSG